MLNTAVAAILRLTIASLFIFGAANAAERPFEVEAIVAFEEPWAMAFLPDGRLLVTEKRGKLFVVTQDGRKSPPVANLPEVAYGGQGGLGDIALHPEFDRNKSIYLSYAEPGDGGRRGAAVARATLDLGALALNDLEVIWRQVPKVRGQNHYGHRLLFDSNGLLFISSGERAKFDPAQDMSSNLGKIVRLRDDGSIPDDNPFASVGGVTAQVWTLGHRNPLGIAFDADGQLWNVEMGPRGGDELNRVVRGSNYGYPIVSNGDHYMGKKIPDHDTHPEFAAPAAWWTPVISPGGFIVYDGEQFPDWKGDALIAGLSSRSLIRVDLDGENAREIERFDMGKRMRAIVQGPAGAVWMLEDRRGGRLLKLTPSD
jgi:glucose/arabinose dehydrogenase